MCGLIFLFLVAPVFCQTGFDENNLKILLFTRENPSSPQVITDANLQTIDTSRDAKFIVFGWFQNPASPWIPLMTTTYLAKGSYNVFVLDWSTYSNTDPVSAASFVSDVGKYFGKFINKLITSGYSISKMHLVGFSMGAHVSASAGREVQSLAGQKLPRISALDASKPIFGNIPTESQISKDAAVFMDAIHTDGIGFGTVQPYAHFDSYPNGGIYQLPCPIFVPFPNSTFQSVILGSIFCSHTRSIYLWIESIQSNGFIAKKCANYFQFLMGMCTDSAIMGENASPSTSGVYYLNTNLFPPYAQN